MSYDNLKPNLAKIYYHELNVFNNIGIPWKIPIPAIIVADNSDETNRTNSLKFKNNSSDERRIY